MKRGNLTQNELVLSIAALTALCVGLAFARLSAGEFMAGLGWVFSYAAGKVNGWKHARATEYGERREDEYPKRKGGK